MKSQKKYNNLNECDKMAYLNTSRFGGTLSTLIISNRIDTKKTPAILLQHIPLTSRGHRRQADWQIF